MTVSNSHRSEKQLATEPPVVQKQSNRCPIRRDVTKEIHQNMMYQCLGQEPDKPSLMCWNSVFGKLNFVGSVYVAKSIHDACMLLTAQLLILDLCISRKSEIFAGQIFKLKYCTGV